MDDAYQGHPEFGGGPVREPGQQGAVRDELHLVCLVLDRDETTQGFEDVGARDGRQDERTARGFAGKTLPKLIGQGFGIGVGSDVHVLPFNEVGDGELPPVRMGSGPGRGDERYSPCSAGDDDLAVAPWAHRVLER
ncbi:hypothetical protein [Streptomyces sp. NPDC059425]|uniref:hypothetical protein n=1 Tax=Streptomyces sp. NPDC059425 TaxID=3346826 RepID=UPI0036ABC787